MRILAPFAAFVLALCCCCSGAVAAPAALVAARARAGGDPSGSWLSFARFDAPAGSAITLMNATAVVPEAPKARMGAAPSFWYGLQTAKGDGALIQPILAWGQRESGFGIFLEVFDWTNFQDHQSPQSLAVEPGDVLTQSVSYRASDRSYDMYIHSQRLGKSITMNFKLLAKQTEPEASAFIVVEHQPGSCNEFPANGNVTFSSIRIEVDGKPVRDPAWVPAQKDPACKSRAEVLANGDVALTWDPK